VAVPSLPVRSATPRWIRIWREEGRGGEGRRGGGGGPENRDGKAGVAGGRGEREKVALGEGVEG
jgi:hypothetical protein